MKKITITLLFLSVLALPVVTWAKEGDGEDDDLKSLAVQNRKYALSHEFSAWVGTLPMDAFTKGLSFTGAYTLHFSDVIAWEVGQFTYSHRIDTDLKADLENLQQPAAPTPFEVVKYFVTSSVLFKPVYAKMAVLNSTVIFGEMFILAGGGYGWMTITRRPVVDYGAGMRLYIGKYFSVRIDIRDYLFVNKDDVQSELWVAMGLCFGF